MYKLKYHPSLTPERWSGFPTERQLFMVANEINRLINGIQAEQTFEDLKLCIERALELTDLSIACCKGNLQFELLRWRGVLSEFYLLEEAVLRNAKTKIEELLKVLLSLNAQSAVLC